jgi:guanylate kinase
MNKDLILSRSWTTRARRSGESGGSYNFVSREEFEKAISEDQFYEWAEFLGNLYGTPKPSPDMDRDLLLEIDIQGAEQVRAKDPSAVVILVVAPSTEEQRKRMLSRGDDPESVVQRVLVGTDEIERAKKFANYLVVNDDLDRAVGEISSIINSLRSN